MKKGIALLWSLVLTTVLMIITGSMATVMIRESQMVVDIVDSNQAYYNAKTGMEWAEYYVSSIGLKEPVGINDTKIFYFTYPDGGKSEVIITKTGADQYRLESQGRGIDEKNTRKLVFSWSRGAGSGANLINKTEFDNGTDPDEIGLGTNSGSFDITFNFWVNGAGVSPNNITVIGADRETGGANAPRIGMGINAGVPQIFWQRGGSVNTQPLQIVGDTIKPGITDETRSYTYKAKINYLKDSRIYIVIEEMRPDFSGYRCIGYGTADVSGLGFGTLDTIGAEMPAGTPALKKSDFSNLYLADPYYLEMGNVIVANFYIRKY